LWQRWLRRAVLGRPLPYEGRAHGLPGELIVSLTSYPARYSILHVTLRSLLTQTVRADRVILWLAYDDVTALPASVRDLQRFGLEIHECDDIRSFKKLVPSVESFPEAFIVTADDDLYYPPDWLEILVSGADEQAGTIVCRRAVRPVMNPTGGLASFNDWEWDVGDEEARRPSRDIMLESGAGALFPPRSLHKMLVDRSLFMEICPEADDLWFNTCARMAGSCCKKVGGGLWLTSWQGSQGSSLWEANAAGGNDRVIEDLRKRFGLELFLPSDATNCKPPSARSVAPQP
jgi:hypothetical protein